MRKVAWLFLIEVLYVGICAAQVKPHPRPPELIVFSTQMPPQIDGRLDDACWQKADKATPFYVLGGKGEIAQPPTTALVCFDSKRLYIAFICDEPQAEKLKAEKTDYDAFVYQDDCVEVYFDAHHDHLNFYHVVVNPKGVRFDEARFRKRWHKTWWHFDPEFQDWDPNWQAAAQIERGKWTVEIALPFAAFPSSANPLTRSPAGRAWGINFCRSRKVDGEQNSCWAYIDGKSFHAPQSFGHLVFAGIEPLKPLKVLKKPHRKPSPPTSLPLGEGRRGGGKLAFRGWHVRAPRQGELDFYRKFIDLLSLLKFNTLVLEVNDLLRYERHPEISQSDACTKEQLRELIAYAKARNIEVIPQVQTFGHFNWVLTKSPQLRQLAEDPTREFERGPYAYCPRKPEVYELVFDIFEEVIDVFQPRYFHIGHDEVTLVPIGVCEQCKSTPPHQLFAEDVIKLHDWLLQRGTKTMMWGDQLLPDHTGGLPYNTHLAIDLLPKDIIICDWHYGANTDYPSLAYFKQRGFDVIACGWYHAENVFYFIKQAAEQGCLGYLGTTWMSPPAIVHYPELMSAIVLASHYSISPGAPPLEWLPYHPTSVFQDLWHIISPQEPPQGTEFFLVDLRRHCNALLAHTPIHPYALWHGLERESSWLKPGVLWLEGIPFFIVNGKKSNGKSCIMLAGSETTQNALPESVWQIPVGSKATALYFLHTTTDRRITEEDFYTRYGRDPRKVGSYVIHYEDGSEETIDLVFRQNITEWNDRLGCSQARIVWQGHTKEGALIQLCAYEWRNPHPDKLITAIDFHSERTALQPILVAVTGLR